LAIKFIENKKKKVQGIKTEEIKEESRKILSSKRRSVLISNTSVRENSRIYLLFMIAELDMKFVVVCRTCVLKF
jgi:hypothetical protein